MIPAPRRPERRCPHDPQCPAPAAPDRKAARAVARHPEQGWTLLCNGLIVFDDGGELLPDGTAGRSRPAQAGRGDPSSFPARPAARILHPAGHR